MQIAVYLYDAKGSDAELKKLEDVNLKKLNDKQLLWIDILKRDEKTIEPTISALQMENVPVKTILNVSERPKIDKFEDFYRLFIVSVEVGKEGKLKRIPIDFLVGKNYVVSIHDGEVDYFKEFRAREKGETQIGELDAESFIATLLDLHIVSYFRALEDIEIRVDRFDEKVLKVEMETQDFLSEMVTLRQSVSKLRRWFLPHRDVFYALSRPDFTQIADSDSIEHFKMLNQHFESAVDAIEDSRETVLSVFDLYATKSDRTMNVFIQRLTFLTMMLGILGVVAGILGMNYEVDVIFKSPYGFWLTVGGMASVAVGLTIFAKFRRWI
ncbi:MAG TPA: CorA family divalent cation transporter [Pyrinomonadaceae bacterium]